MSKHEALCPICAGKGCAVCSNTGKAEHCPADPWEVAHLLIAQEEIDAKLAQLTIDRAYLAWIHTLPCLVGERQTTPTEAHHAGPRAFGRKAPARCALPLCREHHRTGRTAVHRLGKQFWAYHGIDPQAEIARLNKEFDAA
jgi:hypothetical protein